jgi:outer membrane protein assembly factor BamB
MIQLCTIVEYLHAHRPPIIFRDLKPSNVILTPDQRIILIDFGIAKVFAADEKQTNVGTQGYAAREQYKGEAEIRSDVYALGGMMHHLLTKSDPRFQPPFSFHERPPSKLNPAVGAELERVIMRCLEDDRERRYQTVSELRIALEDALHMTDTSYFRTIEKVGGSMPARGPIRTGATTFTIGRNLRERWRFRTEEEIRSTPTAANGVLYVGSYDSNLYALDTQSGSFLWKYATEGGICCQPAVWRNLVIFGSEDFYVYALDLNGTEVWSYRTQHHVRSSPRIYEDRLYIGSDDACMHAIDPQTGRMIWKYRAYREVQTSAAFARANLNASGLIYFGAMDEYCYAVDALTGDKKWAAHAQAGIVSSPAVVGEYVYFGSMDFGVYALDAKSGWQAWREPTEKFVISSPRIVGDRLYIGSSDRHLHCLDRRTGKHIWKYPAGGQVTSTPAFYNNTLYFGCVDGALYALDADSGKLLGRYETGDKICGSPIVEDGVVYVGSSDCCVYALDAIS